MFKGSRALLVSGLVSIIGVTVWRMQGSDIEAAQKTMVPARNDSAPAAHAAESTFPIAAAERSGLDSLGTAVARPSASANAQRDVQPAAHEQRVFELEQRFELDLPADTRAQGVGRVVRAELERALSGQGELRGVDCKLNTCRASLAFPTLDADQALFRKILAAGEGPFASFAMRAKRDVAPDGNVSTVLYFYL